MVAKLEIRAALALDGQFIRIVAMAGLVKAMAVAQELPPDGSTKPPAYWAKRGALALKVFNASEQVSTGNPPPLLRAFAAAVAGTIADGDVQQDMLPSSDQISAGLDEVWDILAGVTGEEAAA